MKNSKLTSVSIIAAMFFVFPVFSCSKANSSTNNNLPVEAFSLTNSTETFPTPKPSINNKSEDSESLLFLKKWVGKYPINKGDNLYSNLFNVPQVKNILFGIVGKDGFQNLLKHFAAPVLIEERSGFLKIFGTTSRNANQDVDYGLMAINIKTGETHVFLADNQKLVAYSNTKGNGTLPIEIKESILTYTGQSSFIEKIKQKPDEGYICYAVLFNDWDAPQEKRPYIFYITDDGGRMNIEGKDIELKLKSETEKKGEGGKTYVDWVYENKDARAHFDMVVSEILDSSAVVYDGTLILSTYSKTQSVQIKAFCGG